MSITITEDNDSREATVGDNPTITLRYTLVGTADDLAAKAALLAEAPTTYDNLARGEVDVVSRGVDEDTGEGIWKCEVVYGNVTALPFDYTISFDTTGGTQHITQALLPESVSVWKAPWYGLAANHHGAIGVTGHGDDTTVEGVDVVSPTYTWTETHWQPDDVVTADYRERLFVLTGRFNESFFREYLPGEALFMGAAGGKTGYSPLHGGDDEWWEISYRFAAQLTVGHVDERLNVDRPASIIIGEIEITEKYGWDYLWVQYGRYASTQAAAGMIVKPMAAFIERVYRPGDFSWLQIGT